jgi:DNA primase
MRTQPVEPGLVQELLDESGVAYEQNVNSFIIQPCPKCGKSDKLYVYKDTGHFICFVCAETEKFTGSLPWLLKHLGMDYEYARTRLYGGVKDKEDGTIEVDLRYPWAENSDLDDDVIKVEEERVPVEFPPHFVNITDEAARTGKDYLEGRGIPWPVAHRHGIRYDPQKKQVIFPLIEDGKLYGWQARRTDTGIIVDKQTGKTIKLPKAITTAERGVVAKTLMFGENLKGSEHVIICEGPVDALKTEMCGGGVATLGKSVKDGQLDIIRRLGIKRVYIGLDRDAGAEAQSIAKRMADRELYLLHPPPDRKDLGECTFKEVEEQFKAAPRIHSLFLFPT